MSETTERPTIEERYITADGSSEVIAAAGLASLGEERERVTLALLLWAVTYEGKSELKHHLVERLAVHVRGKKARDSRIRGDAWKVATEVLAWHLHGICTQCDGRGYEQIQNTPSLSKNLCGVCHGTGKRPYPREAAHVWLVGELASLSDIAAREVMKRLAAQMDL